MGLASILGYSSHDDIFDFSKYVDGVFPNTVDLSFMNWSLGTDTPGTDGSYFKAQYMHNGRKYFLKASAYNIVDGFCGLESYVEFVASRVGVVLGFDVLVQYLIPCILFIDGKSWSTVVCISESYKDESDLRVNVSTYANIHSIDIRDPECIELFCDCDRLYGMMVFDYIMCQMDRHESNIEYLVDQYTEEYRLAPYFDNGMALTSACMRDVSRYTEDRKMYSGPVNNFLGYKDLESNLVKVARGNYTLNAAVLPYSVVSPLCRLIDTWIVDYWFDMLCRRYNYALEILSS